ncbi:MAG: mechanosensitive ion channel family protein [Bacteroidetes bacterium]|nr:mechanosensitive ion channel family protein [Bacteroidota bacterium]
MEPPLPPKPLHTSLQHYLILAAIPLVGGLLLRLFRNVVLIRLHKWAEKTETTLDDIAVRGIEKFLLPILNIGLVYYAVTYLQLSESVKKVVDSAAAVVLAFYSIRVVTTSVEQLLQAYVRNQENGEAKVKQLRGITAVINIGIWTVGLVILFDNLGYNVTAIVTGLGIGGIAIALAAQNILGDLFNYFVIFFDRPVEVGDYIVVNDKKGTIEHIGLKTTRIRSISGEQLIMANSALTGSWIHNYQRMQRRRSLFNLNVAYETPVEKLKAIPALIKQIILEHPRTTFDRAHFATYGSFSLNFEVVFFVESADYNEFMDIQQSVNLRIFEEFAKRGIAFAYPTQKILVEKENQAG